MNRLSEDVYRELAGLFRELKDPRIDPMLSIVHIDLSNDLSFCKVYVSSINGKEAAEESCEGLKSAKGWLKRELFHRLKIRKCPELLFYADSSIEYGAYMDKKINDVIKEDDEKLNIDNTDNQETEERKEGN